MTLTLQPVLVRIGSVAEKGCLVFQDGQLVAVLTRLSEQHEGVGGEWFLEHGFDGLDGPDHPTFADLDAAQQWIEAGLRRTRPVG